MRVPPTDATYSLAYATRVQKVVTDTGVSEGQAAVELIRNAEIPPPESPEKGTHINTVA